MENSIFIGTGGCGRYLVDKVSRQLELTSRVILLDTEKDELQRKTSKLNPNNRLFHIPPIHEGLGDGPYLNYRAIEHGFDNVALDIEIALRPFNTVFLFTSLGRHSGSALSFKVAELCKKIGKPVVSFAVTPFEFESRVNKRMAIIYSEKLRELSLLFTTISNSSLFNSANPEDKMKSYYDTIAQYACDSTRLAAQRLQPLLLETDELPNDNRIKPVVVHPSFVTYLTEDEMLGEGGMLDVLLGRIRHELHKVSTDLDMEFDEIKTMYQVIDAKSNGVNAGRCCVCNRWMSAQNKEDPIIQLCVGAEFKGDLFCMKHLPYESEMYPILHGLD